MDLNRVILFAIIVSACIPVSTGVTWKLAALVGKPIKLPCRLPDGVRHEGVMWYMGKTMVSRGMLVFAYSPRFEINKPVPNELNLVINSVVKSDDELFTCKTFNRVISKIDLEVQWKPQFDESQSSAFQVQMTEGYRGTLKCTAAGKPQPLITWYRRPQKVGSQFTDIGVTGHTLTLPQVTRYVNDVFMCNASNAQGSVYREMNVTVNFAPDVQIMENDMYVKENEKVLVTCLVQGTPLVDFYWKRYESGERIENNWKYKVHVEHQPGYPSFFMTLMIRANTLGQDDFGTYVCHADGLGQEAENKIRIMELRTSKKHKVGR